MKVFASNYLEPLTSEIAVPTDDWNWQPVTQDLQKIYGSGNKTVTKSSTYSSEKDNESDTDRPNEGK